MSRLVEFESRDGRSVLVEVDDQTIPTTRGWRDEGRRDISGRAQESFEAAVDRVRPAADALLTSMAGLTYAPDEVSVDFAVQLSAEAGAFIAQLGSSATFRVQLTWRRPEDTT
jgi:hypothetical protein